MSRKLVKNKAYSDKINVIRIKIVELKFRREEVKIGINYIKLNLPKSDQAP